MFVLHDKGNTMTENNANNIDGAFEMLLEEESISMGGAAWCAREIRY